MAGTLNPKDDSTASKKLASEFVGMPVEGQAKVCPPDLRAVGKPDQP